MDAACGGLVALSVACAALLVWNVLMMFHYRALFHHLVKLAYLVNIMKLAGATTERHQYVGMQQLAKLAASANRAEALGPDPEPEREPDSPGISIHGTLGM